MKYKCYQDNTNVIYSFFLYFIVKLDLSICRNVVSFSDGLPKDGSGIPYFYLTALDPTARNAFKDQRASFTVSEYPLGTCGMIDPENPTCSKITLTGKVSEKMNPIVCSMCDHNVFPSLVSILLFALYYVLNALFLLAWYMVS